MLDLRSFFLVLSVALPLLMGGRATAYFPPDEATKKLFQDLHGEAAPEEIMRREIETLYGKMAKSDEVWKVKYTVVDELPGGSLAQIVPEFRGKNSSLTVHLRITKEGIRNPAVVMEELIHLQQVTGVIAPWASGKNFAHFYGPYQWAEVVANSRSGNMPAVEMLAQLEVEATYASADAAAYYTQQGLLPKNQKAMGSYLNSRKAHAEVLYAEVAKKARVQNGKAKAAWERAKKAFARLESQKMKLNDLVARGDRKGVRKLVETYLPWDLMGASETKAWKGWLEALERPDKNDMQLVFRGLDGDFVFKAADESPFFMSTVLTKNQGNYTRRLRSLSIMREKIGMNKYRTWVFPLEYGKVKGTSTLSAMMSNHARKPLGSPFVSTSVYDVAASFGKESIAAINVDKRRSLTNLFGIGHERERLVPLIVFPDEVVYMHDYVKNPIKGGEEAFTKDKNPLNQVRKKHFIGEVEKRLGRKVSEAEISGKGMSEKAFFNQGREAMSKFVLDGEELHRSGPACKRGDCKCLLQSLNALLLE